MSLAFLLLIVGQSVSAVALNTGLDDAAGANGAGFIKRDPAVLTGQLISVVVGLVGILFLILTVYAGILWMTAAGDEKQVTKAKSILVRSVIGLVIVLSAYTITSFVVQSLMSASGSPQVGA